MPSPGPTTTMPARKVRQGDVMYLLTEDMPYAVTEVVWLDSVGGQPITLGFRLSCTVDGREVTGWYEADADALLDVTRPFDRHDTTGVHDL